MGEVLAVLAERVVLVSVVRVMTVLRPDEQRTGDEGYEANDEYARECDCEEAATGLVRVPPARRADLDRLDQRRRLVGHLL